MSTQGNVAPKVVEYLRAALRLSHELDEKDLLSRYALRCGTLESAIELAITSLESAAAKEGA